MASNSFGKVFKITTWGESHGKGIGVIIDGCPSGIEITEEEINEALTWRAPGANAFTSPRKEPDRAEILSGLFEGKTTGTPISIMIRNMDVDSRSYDEHKHLLKPGHANFTYLEKYGIFDYRGSGRASARETACRVAAGAVAKKVLQKLQIEVTAYIKQIGSALISIETCDTLSIRKKTLQSAIFCPCEKGSMEMITLLEKAKTEGDSLGGIVEFIAQPIPIGLGDPVYNKLEASLAYAMMGLPASKGFEIGAGFKAAAMSGSEHNDSFILENDQVRTRTNHSGGTLGGISNGMPLIGRVAFKPPSSLKLPQPTLDLDRQIAILQQPDHARHDPCVAIRGVPVVEAMLAIVLADALLLNRCAKA